MLTMDLTKEQLEYLLKKKDASKAIDKWLAAVKRHNKAASEYCDAFMDLQRIERETLRKLLDAELHGME